MSAVIRGEPLSPTELELGMGEPRGVECASRGRGFGWAEWAVVLTVASIWPVWVYLFRAYTAPGADTAPALVLGLALGWALVKWWPSRAECKGTVVVPAALLAAFCASYLWLPPLARATLGLAAVGSSLMGLRGLSFRSDSGLLALLLLAAPAADTVSFFLGAPIRAASAQVAAAWLSMGGVPVSVEGAMLRVGRRLFSVDAPCSGVNGLWSALVVAACLAVHRRLGPGRTVTLLIAATVLCIPSNGWRAASLVYLSRFDWQRFGLSADLAHSLVGVVVFAVTIAALAVLATIMARKRPGAEVERAQEPVVSLRPTWPRWAVAALLACATAAAAVPLVPHGTAPRAAGTTFPGWPDEWLGRPLRRLPETDLDRRWSKLSPAPLARFALTDGGELLLRWTDRAGRWLHPPEDCYRGHGYEVTPLPPVRAAAPGNTAPVIWRRFAAQKGAERLEVRSVILSEAGSAYPDPAWWWWHVSGPGAKDVGPWWVATVQLK